MFSQFSTVPVYNLSEFKEKKSREVVDFQQDIPCYANNGCLHPLVAYLKVRCT